MNNKTEDMTIQKTEQRDIEKGDLVINYHKNYEGIIFKVERIGDKRVSLSIAKPTPDKDGFVTKYFKTGSLEAISVYKRRTMTRDFFNKHFRKHD